MTTPNDSPSTVDPRVALRPDCAACFALCCTALGFERSTDFPVDKAAGTPCGNLADDFSCTIHDQLRGRGYRGCTVFDCSGAGQYVAQDLFGGRSWRERPESRADMFAVFAVVRQLHELLWYLVEAEERTLDRDLAQRAAVLRESISSVLRRPALDVLRLDVRALQADVRPVLIEVSVAARGGYGDVDDADLQPGADLIGRDLSRARLCGADLRGAYLIAVDLRRSTLADVDLLGADLRDARLDAADLSRALFLTQAQVNAARGDARTSLPSHIERPTHWTERSTGTGSVR